MNTKLHFCTSLINVVGKTYFLLGTLIVFLLAAFLPLILPFRLVVSYGIVVPILILLSYLSIRVLRNSVRPRSIELIDAKHGPPQDFYERRLCPRILDSRNWSGNSVHSRCWRAGCRMAAANRPTFIAVYMHLV